MEFRVSKAAGLPCGNNAGINEQRKSSVEAMRELVVVESSLPADKGSLLCRPGRGTGPMADNLLNSRIAQKGLPQEALAKEYREL